MKNLFKLTAVILISWSFLTSCSSKSGERLKVEEKMQANLLEEVKAENQILDKKTLSEIDSVFEKTSKDIDAFVSSHDNWADSYYWKSENSDDNPYNLIRLTGMRVLPDFFCIERRSLRKNSTDVVGYSVRRKKKDGKITYMVETSFFRKNQAIESRREVFALSTVEEVTTALKPFYKRLEEAKQDVAKNISRIESMADKS
ncbi:MAG: hypothetical protein ACI9AR_000304 [Flavobacteriaceae bacterium]|jgi:hypothetical protein